MKLLLKLMMLTMITFVIANLQSCQQESLTDEILDNNTVQYYHYKERVYTIQTAGTPQKPEMVESQDSKDLIQLLQEKALSVETSESDPSRFYLHDEPVILPEEGSLEDRSSCIALHRINILDPGPCAIANCFDVGSSILAEFTADPLLCGGGCSNDIVITLEQYFPYFESRTLYSGNAWNIKVGPYNVFKFQKYFTASSGLYRIKVRNTCTQSISTPYLISVGGYLNEAFCI